MCEIVSHLISQANDWQIILWKPCVLFTNSVVILWWRGCFHTRSSFHNWLFTIHFLFHRNNSGNHVTKSAVRVHNSLHRTIFGELIVKCKGSQWYVMTPFLPFSRKPQKLQTPNHRHWSASAASQFWSRMTFSDVCGHFLWRLHTECPKTYVMTVMKVRSRPGKPNQRKDQNKKFMNFAHCCVNSGVFP